MLGQRFRRKRLPFHIKADLFADGQSSPTRRAAATAIFDYFETFYNRRRLHNSLAYRSVDDFLNDYFQNNNPPLK